MCTASAKPSQSTDRRTPLTRCWLRLTLLTVVGSAIATLSILAARQAGDPQSGVNQAGWYLRSGQWQADARTLVAAIRFVMDTDNGPSFDTIPLVRHPATTMIDRYPDLPEVRRSTGQICGPTNSCPIESKPTCNS